MMKISGTSFFIVILPKPYDISSE
uniref:Uncharacterized protein n=1 Tax=Arundo donax TaxID=35708 RepID=A0A0A9ALT0_ARUDO